MTAFLYVNYGNTANDGTGDPIRNAFQKIDENFSNIASGNITVTVNTPVLTVANRTGNIILSVNDVAGAASIAYVNNLSTIANTNIATVSNSWQANAAVLYNDILTNNANEIELSNQISAANTKATLYTMGNYQNWTSNVTTISSALDQLAARLHSLGH